MKLNNKGITLTELLVTIVLIGIVLLFLFQLLVDIKGETETNTFAYNNQYNRTEALYRIEEDIRNNQLTGIFQLPNSGNTIMKYNFKFKDGKTTTVSITLDGNKYYLEYNDINGNPNKWQMKGTNIDKCVNFISHKGDNGDFYFKIAINVYNQVYQERNTKKHNNLVDDLEIMGVGKTADVTNEADNLLNSDISNRYIGTCTD